MTALRRCGFLVPMPALTWDSDPLLQWDAIAVTWDGQAANNNHTNMPNDNRISAEVTAANKTAILTKIVEIKGNLPFLINLTKNERIQMPKFGPASLAFDEQCATYMASAPNLIPPFVTLAEVTKDRALRLVLSDIVRELRKLCEMVDDTLMQVGSEIWLADLSFYQTVRQAARRDVPGADTIYDDLKERFPTLSGDPEEPTDPETPPTP